MLSALEPAFKKVAEVSSVPFPGVAFDNAAEDFDPDLVVVDVTYLDESIVRPLITHRFELGEIVAGFELFEARRDGVIKVAVGV